MKDAWNDSRTWGPGHLLQDTVFYTLQESVTHEILAVWSPEQDLYNDSTNWYSNLIKNHPTIKERESNVSKKEPPGRLSNPKWSTLNAAGCIYIHAYICVHMYMQQCIRFCVTTIITEEVMNLIGDSRGHGKSGRQVAMIWRQFSTIKFSRSLKCFTSFIK